MTETISTALKAIFEKYPNNTAIEVVYDNSVKTLTYSQLQEMIQQGAQRLLDIGVQPGDRIGIVSENKAEWIAACFAILEVQATAVLFDQMLSVEDFSWVFREADTSALFISSYTLNKFRNAIAPQNITLNIDHFFQPNYMTSIKINPKQDNDRDPSLAFIAFTSGTGGIQRGVMLTHQNILLNVETTHDMVGTTVDDRFLCLLPLNHMFSISTSVINVFLKGGTAIFLDRLGGDLIVKTLQEKGVTGFSAVPRLYESMHKGIFDVVEKRGKLTKTIFKGLLNTLYLLRTRFGINLGPKILKTVHKKMGAKLRFMACGGAPLASLLLKDFHAMGFNLLVGYGLTETSPIVTANTLKNNFLYTVGRPNKYSEVFLANTSDSGEGEVCVKGPCVMKGYFRQPESTQQAIVDNWFHTGDLGTFNSNGSLMITGRIKELIVLSSGKKIAPESIENHFINIPIIKEFAIVGLSDAEKFGEEVSAAVVANTDKKFPDENMDQFLRRVAHKIMQVSSQFPAYEHIQRVYFVDSLPKTTTLKVKRNVLRKTLAELTPYHAKNIQDFEAVKETQDVDLDQYMNGVIDVIRILKKSDNTKILPRTSLQFDLNMDSLDRLNLQHDLEKRFGIRFKSDVLFSAERVDDVARIVRELQRDENVIDEEIEQVRSEPFKQHKLPAPSFFGKIWNFLLNCLFDLTKVTYNLKVVGLENIPKEGSYILAANHTSNLDGFWVIAALPRDDRARVYSFMKQEYFDNPITRKIVTMSRAIPVRREGDFSSALKEGLNVLGQGEILLIFPEGARSATGRISHFHHGTAHLALKSQSIIIPVCIDGGYKIYPTSRLFPHIFNWKEKERYQATVTFCKPIYPIYYQSDRSSEAILTSNILQEILKVYQGPS
jgi:long-chain acyl-CoA synthetase